MDIISINVAANKALLKLREDGIEALTLNGTDGKQYELVVKDGKLELFVKGSEGDNNTIKIGAPEEYAGALHIDCMSGYGYYFKISDRVLTQEELNGCVLYFEPVDMSESCPSYEGNLVYYWDEMLESRYGAALNEYPDNPVILVIPSIPGSVEHGTYVGFDAIMDRYGSIHGAPGCTFASGEIRLNH